MRVKDIMSQPVYTVRAVDTVQHAAEVLADNKITAAPVLDETGRLVGMVSEGDLLWHRVPAEPTARLWPPEGGDALELPKTVAEVMSKSPLTTFPQADVADVARTMLYHEVRSMPVVDTARIVGIVSRRDILRTVIRTDDILAGEVQHRLDEYAGGVRRWNAAVTDAIVTVEGTFDDETEQGIVAVMARTVPGVAAVQLTEDRP